MNKCSIIPRPEFDPELEEPHREFYGYEDFKNLFGVTPNGCLFNQITRQGAKRYQVVGENTNGSFSCFKHNWKVKDVIWLLRYKEWPKHKLVHLDGDYSNNSECNLVEEMPKVFDRIEFDIKLDMWKVRVFPKSRQNKFKPNYFFNSLKEAIDFRNKYAIDFEPTQTTNPTLEITHDQLK